LKTPQEASRRVLQQGIVLLPINPLPPPPQAAEWFTSDNNYSAGGVVEARRVELLHTERSEVCYTIKFQRSGTTWSEAEADRITSKSKISGRDEEILITN
jgi:hypothetical protein